MNIHLPAILMFTSYFDVHQGYKVLTHPQMVQLEVFRLLPDMSEIPSRNLTMARGGPISETPSGHSWCLVHAATPWLLEFRD